MIKIEFDGHQLTVPDCWHDVPLCDYEDVFARQPQSKGEYVTFMARVCKVEPAVLLKAPVQLFEVLTNAIAFIYENHFEPKHTITIEGQEHMIAFADKLTLGEWVDVESALESENGGRLSDLLAILCRPVGEDYDSDQTEQRKEMFKRLPCDEVLPLVAFFLHKKKQSDEISNLYSTVKAQVDLLAKDIDSFAANGDGIKLLPIWQRIKYTFLMRSLKKELSKFSDF